MKWFLLALLIAGLCLIAIGYRITQWPGSADERVAGSVPLLAGMIVLALDFIIAMVWLVVTA